jgi:flagellar motility protein MotE (MotC chaperone)
LPGEKIFAEKKATQKPQETVHLEPQKPKRIAKRVPKGIYSPSIKDALQGKFENETEEISAIEQHKLHTKAEEVEDFTADDLAAKWKEFLVRLNDRPNLQATLSKVPELKENGGLFLELDNSIQNDLVNTIKPELISFLRRKLRNDKIELATQVSKKIKNKIIYTDNDKFGAMAKKNPSLAKLKQKFNLDFGEV